MARPASTATDLGALLLRTLLASLAVAAVAALAAILADGELGATAARALLTAGALMLYSLAALAATSLVARRPGLVWLSVLGLSSSAIGLVITLTAIWVVQPAGEGLVRDALVLLAATLATSFAALLLRSNFAKGRS